MNPIRGLLFDFNGTLFYDSEMHFRAFYDCFDYYGIPPIPVSEIPARMFGRSNEQIFRENFKADATEEEILGFEHRKEALYQENCLKNPSMMHLVAGADELFRDLKKRKIPYCMATGSPLVNVSFYLQYLVGDYFSIDNVIYTDGSFRGKPHPDIYLRAAERLGLDPSECAVFEDGTNGIQAANAAGIGRVICVYEEGIADPVTPDVKVDLVLHDFTDRQKIYQTLGWNF